MQDADNSNTDAADTSDTLGADDTSTDTGAEDTGSEDTSADTGADTGADDSAGDEGGTLGADDSDEESDGGDEDDKGDKEVNELIGAPEEDYADFEMPEGFEELDEEVMADLLPTLKKMNLSQAGAQALIDKHAAHMLKAANSVVERQQAQWTETTAQWKKDLRSDGELGGAEFKGRMSVANAGMKAVDPDGKLASLAKQMNLTNNPDFVRAFYKIGKMTSGDSVDGSGGGGRSDKETPIGEILFK